MDTLEIGPGNGTLSLHTGVEGKAAKMGHDLTIVLADWSASTTFEGEAPASVTLRAALASLEIVKGEGGMKSLSDKDKQTIRDNALGAMKAAQHPDATFTSSRVAASPTGWDLTGQLSIAGTARPVTLHVEVTEAGERLALAAVVPVVQTEHGVKPYSAMMGTLKLRDRVEVRLDVTVDKP